MFSVFQSTLPPLANEPLQGVLVKLVDAKLHEDAIHRGPAQVIPAVKNAIYGAIMLSDPIILEPMQKVFINTPQEVMGNVSRELNQRRAVILDMKTEGDMVTIEAKAPVAEMFGFASASLKASFINSLVSNKCCIPFVTSVIMFKP